jgi:succinoglycan biosynthesis transport protein ExoP
MSKNTGNNEIMKRQGNIKPYAQWEQPVSPYVQYPGCEPEGEPHLRDYIGVIKRKKWVVIGFLLSSVIVTAAFTAMTTHLYKSTVVLKIDSGDQNAMSIAGMPIGKPEADYYVTQYEILKSRSVAEQVIRRLNLDKNDNFMPPEGGLSKITNGTIDSVNSAISAIFSFLRGGKQDEQTEQPAGIDNEMPLYLINSLINRLDVDPVKNSQLVEVSFVSHKAALAYSVTKTVAETYIEYDLDSRVASNRKAKDFLTEQIALTRKKLEDSERKLYEYAAGNRIIYLDSDKMSVITQKLSDISGALSAATNERVGKESLFREIKESGVNNPVIVNNNLIQGLRQQYATLEAEYSNLSSTYTPDYPKMMNLKSQIDAVESRITREMSKIVQSTEADYKASLKKESNLKKLFETQQSSVLEFQGKAADYQTLKREVAVNQELHNNLLQKFNEVSVAAMSKATNIQIVDSARFPKAPFKPNTTLNLLLSLFFGLFGGVGLAFLVEYFDDTVRDAQAVEKITYIPSLGMIPFQKELHALKRPLIVNAGQNNPATEIFRSIGTFILLSSSVKQPKTILVTSPGEKEGKTTISINVASVLTESVGRGVIIDADMRKPELHAAFGLDNSVGLSSYLTRKASIDDDGLIKHSSVKGLHVITSGPLPANPSKLLHSSEMREFLDFLCSVYDFVIVDAPPIMGMPDSVFLSSVVDGTILVVKAGVTPRNAIAETQRIFRNVNSNLLGVILNGVQKTDFRYGNYSGYGYGSEYFKS